MESKEKELSADERDAEIKRLQQEKSAHAAALVEREREARETRENTRAINFNSSFLASMGQSGIRWHSDAEDLQKLIPFVGCTLRSSADGRMIQGLDEDGKDIGVVKILERVALKYPNWVKDDSAAHLRPRDANGTFKTLAKSDFKTTQAKVEFIKSAGIDAWSSLPLHTPRGLETNVDRMNADDWRRTPQSVRSMLISEHGAEIVSVILSRRK